MNTLLSEKQYTKEDIINGAIIFHPGLSGYNITANEIAFVFEEGSNFTHLQAPILDEFWNEFWDSEWYYMAKRTNDLERKKAIAFMSIWYWLATKARKMYPLEQDRVKRVAYMREAIRKKFDNNPHLKQKLMDTWEREIIEYTYWNDTFFWINQDTLRGMNVLGRLLMEYRDTHM